jgi:hypothetical protein
MFIGYAVEPLQSFAQNADREEGPSQADYIKAPTFPTGTGSSIGRDFLHAAGN